MRKLTFLFSILSFPVWAGIVIVHHDEWPTSNTGFTTAGGTNAATYTQNLANYFTGGGAGNYLVYSDNLAYGTSFQTALTGAGHTVTVNNALAFTAVNLLAYDAVFLAGNEAGYDTAEATAYVNAGGAIYIAAGTADGFNAATEAAFWNPLLNTFGLTLGTVYNGVGGTLPVAGAHPILAGVAQLYQNNGNTVSLFGGNPNASIILTEGGAGLIGVYDDGGQGAVPEPSTFLLLGAGLVFFAKLRRVRH